MKGVRVHAVVYTAVNAMLVGIWAAAGAPAGFWPIWPMLTWGAALGIHAGVTAGRGGGRKALTGDPRPELKGPDASEAEDWQPVGAGARRKWVAVMFIDISGSTRLNDRLGDETWHRVLADHRGRVRTAVQGCGGAEVGTAGDGVMVRFDHPADAVLCAVEVQCEIDEINRGDGFAPDVRIGIHAGEAVEADQDLLGRVVNLAARVGDEAAAGEILVTESVADEMGPGLPVEDRGLRPLKGLDRPRHLLAVQWSAAVGGSRPPT